MYEELERKAGYGNIIYICMRSGTANVVGGEWQMAKPYIHVTMKVT